MLTQANGEFTVEMLPQAADAAHPFPTRLLLNKRYSGDLTATGHGQMFTVVTPVQGSAGYVAMERVTGSLHGKTGSFVLQHSGTMTRGAPTLTVTIVPDSGTDELAAISGRCQINIENGVHRYVLDYSLPA